MKFAVVLSAFFASTCVAFPSNSSFADSGCTISSYNQVSSVTASCTTIQINKMTVPAGKTLLLHLKSGARVTIAGTITFAYHEWAGPLVEVKGSKVTIQGANGAKLDGLGAKYWDGKGDHGKAKPKFFKIKTTGGSTFNNVDLLNCPHQCFSIDAVASDTTLSGCDIDISAGTKLGKNTDGYDISGSKITITNAKVYNQDDCVAINKGSNIKISKLTCVGGHGLSLSVGTSKSAAKVSNVQFDNCVVKDSRNGIHVKTHADAPSGGSISDVTYSNIQMSGITNYGINVQEDYANGKSTGTAKGNVPITGLNFKNIKGSCNSAAVNVFILCGSGGCKNWNWSGVNVSGGKKPNKCNFTPSGFKC